VLNLILSLIQTTVRHSTIVRKQVYTPNDRRSVDVTDVTGFLRSIGVSLRWLLKTKAGRILWVGEIL